MRKPWAKMLCDRGLGFLSANSFGLRGLYVMYVQLISFRVISLDPLVNNILSKMQLFNSLQYNENEWESLKILIQFNFKFK